LSYSATLLIPEEFSTIQSAVDASSKGYVSYINSPLPDNESECAEGLNQPERQDCLYGNELYSPDNPLIRDLIDINIIEQKTIRVSFYSFTNNNQIPFWSEANYLNVIEDLNTYFADSKINFAGEFNFLNDESLIMCYENDFQEESCLDLPQCSFDRQNQLCYFDKYWIADEYNQSDDSIYVFIGRYKASNGPTPWRNQTIPNNRSVYLTQSTHNHNSKTVIHEFGHKFGLMHTFHGIFFNNGDCQSENTCWSTPNFVDDEFCDTMTVNECDLHSESCYWNDGIGYCKHIGDISGDLCSDTYPVPPPNNSSLCIFPEAECNELVYEYDSEHYNYNFMEYGYGCNEYHFTDQQIQRMHGWIEYEYEFLPNTFSNLCNFLEDYDCRLFGCTDSFACNHVPEAIINDGSCEYEADGTSCSVSGDINNDGNINVIDVLRVVDLILSNNYDAVGDVNEDELLNVIDVVMLVYWILNGIPSI